MAVASNPLETFIWGAGGQKMSPEQVARQREIAAALMQGGMDYSPVDHWLQGAARASQGLVGGLKERWAGEAEQRGREGFQSQWDSVFGGGGSASPVAAALAGGGAGGGPVPPASIPSGDNAAYIRQGLIQRGLPEHVADAFLLNMQDESGLNPGINEAAPIVPGSRGGYGLYQLTGPRRRAYEAYAQQSGIPLDSIDGQLDFLMSELDGPEANAYQAIMAAPDTGSAAAAIVNQFLRPSEQHRARREASYLGGASMPPRNQVAQAGGGNPSVAQLLSLAGNEWANPGQSSVVSALLGQAMQQQDPRYQQQLALGDLQMQQAQFELDALRNPAAPFQPRTLTPEEMAQWGLEGATGSWVTTESGLPEQLWGGPPAPSTDFETITIDVPGVGPQTFNTADPQQYQAANQLLAQGATEVKTPGVQVTTNLGGTDVFDEAFAKADAQAISDISTAGIAAQRNIGRIDQLESLLSAGPSGFAAAAAQLAGEWGIQTEGLDSLQSAQAIINSLVPEQRQPGSGPMSDADLELFKQSLPRLINTPEGNRIIIQTMRSIAEYDALGAQIANRARLPQDNPNYLSRSQVMEALQSRPNPLSAFKPSPGVGGQSQPQRMTQEQYNSAPSGTVFTAPDGSIRVKP